MKRKRKKTRFVLFYINSFLFPKTKNPVPGTYSRTMLIALAYIQKPLEKEAEIDRLPEGLIMSTQQQKFFT